MYVIYDPPDLLHDNYFPLKLQPLDQMDILFVYLIYLLTRSKSSRAYELILGEVKHYTITLSISKEQDKMLL